MSDFNYRGWTVDQIYAEIRRHRQRRASMEEQTPAWSEAIADEYELMKECRRRGIECPP